MDGLVPQSLLVGNVVGVVSLIGNIAFVLHAPRGIVYFTIIFPATLATVLATSYLLPMYRRASVSTTARRAPTLYASLETKFCRYCGAKNGTDAVFCEKCGKKIG